MEVRKRTGPYFWPYFVGIFPSARPYMVGISNKSVPKMAIENMEDLWRFSIAMFEFRRVLGLKNWFYGSVWRGYLLFSSWLVHDLGNPWFGFHFRTIWSKYRTRRWSSIHFHMDLCPHDKECLIILWWASTANHVFTMTQHDAWDFITPASWDITAT